jgi:hypothetical protein
MKTGLLERAWDAQNVLTIHLSMQQEQIGFERDKSLHALDEYCDLKIAWIAL